MEEKLEALVLLITSLMKRGKSDQEISGLINTNGQLPKETLTELLEDTRRQLAKLDVDENNLREKYTADLDEEKLAELIDQAVDLYAQLDFNDYQVKEYLKHLGVDEKYLQQICEDAYEQVRKSIYSVASGLIAFGVIMLMAGTLMFIFFMDFLFGSSGVFGWFLTRFIVFFPFTIGLIFTIKGILYRKEA
ncbi:hypothetical protein [Haliscomenobacter sp.]|uniref:hypothetical protein n=1 Tax=Haliscomenobacter sp. TaxID=2717303 RepID=UPI003364C6BC